VDNIILEGKKLVSSQVSNNSTSCSAKRFIWKNLLQGLIYNTLIIKDDKMLNPSVDVQHDVQKGDMIQCGYSQQQ